MGNSMTTQAPAARVVESLRRVRDEARARGAQYALPFNDVRAEERTPLQRELRKAHVVAMERYHNEWLAMMDEKIDDWTGKSLSGGEEGMTRLI